MLAVYGAFADLDNFFKGCGWYGLFGCELNCAFRKLEIREFGLEGLYGSWAREKTHVIFVGGKVDKVLAFIFVGWDPVAEGLGCVGGKIFNDLMDSA